MKVIYLYGAPAIGKKTVALALSELTRFKVVDNHVHTSLITNFYPRSSKGYWIMREKVRDSIFKSLIAMNEKGIILTGVNESPNKKDIMPLINYFKKLKSKIYFIHLVCDENERKKRVIKPDRKEKPRPNNLFHKISDIDHPTIDISKTKPNVVAKNILKLIQKN